VNCLWTRQPLLAKNKKKLWKFDSFNPPLGVKKGVKPMKQPQPFPEGEGKEMDQSKEEIMEVPLINTKVKELVMHI